MIAYTFYDCSIANEEEFFSRELIGYTYYHYRITKGLRILSTNIAVISYCLRIDFNCLNFDRKSAMFRWILQIA